MKSGTLSPIKDDFIELMKGGKTMLINKEPDELISVEKS